MASCLFRNNQLLPWIISLLVSCLLIFISFLGFGYFSILLICLVLILSTLYLTTYSKQNPLPEHSCSTFPFPQMEEVSKQLHLQNESIVVERKAAQEGGMSQIPENSSTSEDSETDWFFQDNVNQSSACSDGSISDEESFIEIALPTGHYDPKLKLEQKMPEINDMNEENLIEIDISIGSIKCSRFEIEA